MIIYNIIKYINRIKIYIHITLLYILINNNLHLHSYRQIHKPSSHNKCHTHTSTNPPRHIRPHHTNPHTLPYPSTPTWNLHPIHIGFLNEAHQPQRLRHLGRSHILTLPPEMTPLSPGQTRGFQYAWVLPLSDDCRTRDKNWHKPHNVILKRLFECRHNVHFVWFNVFIEVSKQKNLQSFGLLHNLGAWLVF